MAKTNNNKYTSINFNDIYDKTTTSSSPSATTKPSSSAASYAGGSAGYSSSISNYKSHLQNNGRMLVLTRPTPKPISLPTRSEQQTSQPATAPARVPDLPGSGSGSDPISLRPSGRTGALPCATGPVQEVLSSAAKTGKFVPPHLRPGFVAKVEKPGPEVIRGPVQRQQHQNQHQHQQYRYYGRPGSGGYERGRRGGGEADLVRPRSSGNRPNSSGWKPKAPTTRCNMRFRR